MTSSATAPGPDDEQPAVLLLRLSGPLQSWGSHSTFNRRETSPQPTKSGVIGLLAAAAGYAREDPLDDLVPLRLGIRVDQPGTMLRDYHTVSDHRGRPLPQAGVNAKGVQKPTSPPKYTHVTTRYYLQDAMFLVAVAGPCPLLESLDQAVRAPAFPLALGRRSCPPTQPLSLGVHHGSLNQVLSELPWQVSRRVREQYAARAGRERGQRRPLYPTRIDLSVTLEDPTGNDTVHDTPVSFDPHDRTFSSRRIRHGWVSVPTGFTTPDEPPAHETADIEGHDPFALLGW